MIRQLKSRGQVFLKNHKYINQIIAALDEDVQAIVEIGPGQGALTQKLLLKQLPLYAIEIDSQWSQYLINKFSPHAPHFHVITEDFLEFDFLNFYNSSLKMFDHVNIISNLPYYITTPILFKLLKVRSMASNINSLVLMMQKEVGERIIAQPGSKKYNALSVQMQFYYTIEVVSVIGRQHFKPVPQVDSIVLKFHRQENLNSDILNNHQDFFDFVKKMFAFRRKTILNNLSQILNNKSKAYIILVNSGLPNNLRPENLSIGDLQKIYKGMRLDNANNRR